MRIERTVEISAPIDKVFDLIDDPEKLKLWMEGVQETTITKATPGHVGTTFRQKIKEGGRIATYDGEVIAYEALRRVAVRIAGSGFSVDVDYQLSPANAGTRLDYVCTMTMSNWFTRLISRLAAGMNRRIVDKQLSKLKSVAEGGSR